MPFSENPIGNLIYRMKEDDEGEWVKAQPSGYTPEEWTLAVFQFPDLNQLVEIVIGENENLTASVIDTGAPTKRTPIKEADFHVQTGSSAKQDFTMFQKKTLDHVTVDVAREVMIKDDTAMSWFKDEKYWNLKEGAR
eukprot:TRINITY_DN106992_c0_g1_i1.p3 TRINITY_DN106992_c0_g1~~TRINITY_DN106992_c0_g1_i1.p3  ORF type:complete len:137 (-),score=19.35 TRINITY_DN106992_c0_g1_i1:156-566(-)